MAYFIHGIEAVEYELLQKLYNTVDKYFNANTTAELLIAEKDMRELDRKISMLKLEKQEVKDIGQGEKI